MGQAQAMTADYGVWGGPKSEPADRYVSAGGAKVISLFPPTQVGVFILVNRLEGPTREFELLQPLSIAFRYEPDGVQAVHASLPVQGFGSTWEQALAEFCEMFEVQFEQLVECEVSELTDGAVRAREELISYASVPGAASAVAR